jgi:hypothetical protein
MFCFEFGVKAIDANVTFKCDYFSLLVPEPKQALADAHGSLYRPWDD